MALVTGITTSRVDIYPISGTSIAPTGWLAQGTTVQYYDTVIHDNNTAWHIIKSPFEGYVMAQYISPLGSSGGGGTTVTGYITANQVNVRSTPSPTGALVATLNSGAGISLLSGHINCSNDTYPLWYHITAPCDGYVCTRYVGVGSWSGNGTYTSPSGLADAEQRIQAYSYAHANDPNFITLNEYTAALDRIARQPGCGYVPSGKNPSANSSSWDTYTSMCCAYYPFVCRNLKGGHGATTQYDKYTAANIKGTIASLGGINNLRRGMEIYQGDNTTKQHMGVFAGVYAFGGSIGTQPAVYQSVASTPSSSVSLAYTKNTSPNGTGPNLTTLSSYWTYYAWPLWVKLS
jgi:hypothetical protein